MEKSKKTKTIEIFDWYRSNPACSIRVPADGKVSEWQMKKINKYCPNWTRQVDEIICPRSGKVIGGWIRDND